MEGSCDNHLVAWTCNCHHGGVVGTSGSVHTEAAEVGTPGLCCDCLGFKNQGGADAIGVISGKNWDIAINHWSGEIYSALMARYLKG